MSCKKRLTNCLACKNHHKTIWRDKSNKSREIVHVSRVENNLEELTCNYFP